MTDRNEPPSWAESAAPHLPTEGESAGALAQSELLPAFDGTLATLLRQLDAMTAAGWVDPVAAPSEELQ